MNKTKNEPHRLNDSPNLINSSQINTPLEAHLIHSDSEKAYAFLPQWGLIHALTPNQANSLSILENYFRGKSPKSLSLDQTENFIKQIEAGLPHLPPQPRRDHVISFIVAQTCNLACSYCLAFQGTFGLGEGGLISWDICKELIDLCLEADPKIRTLKFFGGEPTLDMEIVELSCAYVMEMTNTTADDWFIGITTNGTGPADDHLPIYRRYKISVSISLDGPKDVHDDKRKFKGGKGSFSSVINYIETLRSKGYPFAIVSVYNDSHITHGYSLSDTANWLNQFSDLVKIEAVENLNENALTNFNVSPEKIFEDSYDLARKVIDTLSRSTSHIQKKVLENNIIRGCHAVVSGYAIAPQRTCVMENMFSLFPNGDVFPCYLFATNQDMRLGQLSKGIKSNSIRMRQLKIRETLNWNEISKGYIPWYRGIVGDICAADMLFPGLDTQQKGQSSPFYAAFQEGISQGLLEGIVSIHEDKSKWIGFLTGLHQQMRLSQEFVGL